MQNTLKFNKNGKFVLMQVADPQDLHFVRHTMVRMLNKAYDTVKPDLVVFAGDNILGNHLKDARFGSRAVVHTKEKEYERMVTAIGHICKPLEERKIPFTMIYGNHDDVNMMTKDEQADIYRSYSMCIGLDNPDKSVDVDTFNLPLYSSDGEKKLFNFWMLDCAGQNKETKLCYEAVLPETIEWYKKKSAELREENGGEPLPSLMFQHIPMPESASLQIECDKDDPLAVPFYEKGELIKYVKLDPEKAHGHLGEQMCVLHENYGQLEALQEMGDVKAVVYAHDHTNNFIGEHDGIRVIQTSCASFRCYGNHLRGVRVFEFDENDPENFKTYNLTYWDLCGDGIVSRAAHLWDADECEETKIKLLIGAGAAAVIGTGAAVAAHLIKRKHNG
ncbi:MAG: metallophosphoesterase [Clostridia bacterium]|nr:metallophosphoesterase [Clostridia bacterium]